MPTDSETWLTGPAGPLADQITRLAWVFGTVAVLVWLVTMTFLAWAVLRGRRRAGPASDEATTRQQARGVTLAALVTAGIIVGLAVLDFLVLRGLHDVDPEGDVLTIEVMGHQWWWEVTYEPDEPRRRFATANEIHIPVGRPVLLRLRSSDVIHSFWVPRLQGKRDLIPGYTNTLWIEADEPGLYRGSCAEFCGIQHGKMHLVVVADPPERFDAWYRGQHAPAAPPDDSLAERGQRIFAGHRCALCHTVRGTPARGQVAPDLTHLASRLTLAAGSLPNTRGHLGGWIVNPHQVKNGVRMPQNPLPGEDLHALLHYLEELR